jgi:ribosomal protein S18 acetylase RimI-like enzyme
VPAWRGRGIGMALLRAAFAAFRTRGLTGVALEVDDVSMDGAVALYRRAGMRIVRRTDVLEQLLLVAPPEAPGS